VISAIPQGSTLGPLLFIVFMNDLPNALLNSSTLLFVDDTKCFRHIMTSTDQQLLQSDLNNLSNWSIISNLLFISSKSCHLSFNQKFFTSYTINNHSVISKQCHKDLGVTLSVNLEWTTHHDIILSKVYKTLGLIRRIFSPLIQSQTKTKLYVSLVWSQFSYCSPIWRPYLMNDINKLEHLQWQAIKFNLNDFISDY